MSSPAAACPSRGNARGGFVQKNFSCSPILLQTDFVFLELERRHDVPLPELQIAEIELVINGRDRSVVYCRSSSGRRVPRWALHPVISECSRWLPSDPSFHPYLSSVLLCPLNTRPLLARYSATRNALAMLLTPTMFMARSFIFLRSSSVRTVPVTLTSPLATM